MATINETKEKMGVVKSVGGFANALQQIAAMRMMSLRDKVMSSKRFVDEATDILRELNTYKELIYQRDMQKADKKTKAKSHLLKSESNKKAVIIVTSNQGLCGKYNAEIFKKVENEIFPQNPDADIFIVGNKGQEHFLTNKKYNYKFYPYKLPDNFDSSFLLRLVEMFPYYDRILMVYSRYINTVNRDVVSTILVAPPIPKADDNKNNQDDVIRFLFEPSIDELIRDVSSKLRAAAFQQQILDSRLAQFSAQMVGMQAATENAKILLDDLNHEYNKQRRKMIDKKISEVFAGSALW